MQTFMPYSDFTKVARCLDDKRLGKQRVEALQIYQTLEKIKVREDFITHRDIANQSLGITEVAKLDKISWANHPIVKMWKGHEKYLAYYGWKMCQEWIARGFKDTLSIRFVNLCGGFHDIQNHTPPVWIYNNQLHLSHQSNLIRKYPEHYTKYFPNVPNNLLYVWVKDEVTK